MLDTVIDKKSNNYYSKKRHELVEKKYSEQDIFREICDIYLNDKPLKVEGEKLNNEKRHQLFWNSDIWSLLPEDIYQTDSFVYVLQKNLRNTPLYNEILVVQTAKIAPKEFKQAIRTSKIFLGHNENYLNLKKTLYSEEGFNDFFIVCDVLADYYKDHTYEVNKAQQQLQSFSYLDLLCLISLYLMKQADHHRYDAELIQSNGTVISQILQDRLFEKDKRKRAIEEKNIQEKFAKYFFSEHPSIDLAVFEEVIHHYKALYNFEQSILYTFCYDDNYGYKVYPLEKYFELKPISTTYLRKWHQNGHKALVTSELYKYKAIKTIEILHKNKIFGLPENHEINKASTILAESIESEAREMYGFDDQIQLNVDTSIPLSHTVHSLSSALAFFRTVFSKEYFIFLENSNDWWKAWKRLLPHSAFVLGKDRMPLLYLPVGFFIDVIKSQFPEPVPEAKDIEQFWTYDLRIPRQTNQKVPNIFEKPFFKMDGFIFQFPWMLAFQNPHTTFMNNMLRVHYQRTIERKDEVQCTESYIAKLFEENGFTVACGYRPSSNPELEIDVLAVKDGHLFILELKSTYIRTTLEEAWIYKSKALRKAGRQLSKRSTTIQELIKGDNNEFLSQFGKPKQIHTWIVDTSFEYDHEYFDGALKISLFELARTLAGENETFYPNGFHPRYFVEIIESQRLWKELLSNFEYKKEDFVYKVLFLKEII